MKKIKNFKWDTDRVFAVGLLIFGLVLPIFMSSYNANIFANFYASVLLCFSLVFIWGYCGTFSFGQAAFYGLGAYVYGVIAGNLPNMSLTPLAAILAVGIVFLFALALGYFMFYGGVNDVFVSIITLCLTLALATFFGQTAGPQWTIGKVALGGYNGMNGIPKLQIGTYALMGKPFYYVVFAIVIIVLFILKHVERSKSGYTMFAIRENRERSALFGYNTAKIQMVVFAIGGAIAALAGVLYASWGGYVNPVSMSMTQATIPVVIVAAGGRKSPTGAMIFGLLYYFVANKLAAAGNEYALIILGVALVLVVLFVPQGLFKSMFDFIDSRIAAQKAKKVA